MTKTEMECIKTLTPYNDKSGYYDNKSGFLHVSFNRLSTTKSLRALIVLMERFNWHIVGINDLCVYGQYDYIPGLKTLKEHPKYSDDWCYVLFKCTEESKKNYKVGNINKLKSFINSILGEDCNKFSREWEIGVTTYLTNITLQERVDLCLYLLHWFGDKYLSLGISDGAFKLYESNGLGS